MRSLPEGLQKLISRFVGEVTFPTLTHSLLRGESGSRGQMELEINKRIEMGVVLGKFFGRMCQKDRLTCPF